MVKEKKKKNQKHKLIQKGHGNEPTVIEFNLSKAVIILIVIGVIIATITTVKVITSIMRAQENKVLAGEETNEHVVWVESSDLDAEGNPIKVPVPKGYTASKIPGETSANNGFVIYEGDVDWDAILVDTDNQNSMSTQDVKEEHTNIENITSDEEATNREKENTTNTIHQNENTITDNTNSQTDQSNTVKQENTSNEQNIIGENEQETPVNSTTENENQIKETTEPLETSQEIGNTIQSEISSETERTTSTEANKEETNQTETENLIQEETNPVESANNIENSTEQEAENSQETTDKNQQTENNVQTLSNDITSTAATNVEPRAVTQQDINIFNLQKERNQYVWVPVKDPSRIYGVDINGKLWGKLYNFPTSNSESRTARNWTETNEIMRITSQISEGREPDVSRFDLNGPNTIKDYDGDSRLQSFLDGRTKQELLTKELEEFFYATIKSIKEYGGFYIGRYETGGLSGTAVVRKMENDIQNQIWYIMYEKAKTLKGENEHIMTSMIWGSLWDETMQWLIESGAAMSDGTKLTYALLSNDSTLWGNYKNSIFNYIPVGSETPEATTEKKELSMTRIPTGGSEYTKVNNIYDLAGNVWEWTLESNHYYCRTLRGGGFIDYHKNIDYATYRYYGFQPVFGGRIDYGCRTVLLIK